MSLGKRINLLRKKIGMTQEELGKYLGMGRSNIGHIENGRVIPTSSDLKKIADVLGTTPNYLLGEEYTKEEQQLINDIDLSDEELLDKYNFKWEGQKLSKEETVDMIKYIRALIIMRDKK